MFRKKLLKRYITDGDNTYETIVLPRALIAEILKMAHDNLGHNGTHRNIYVTQEIILLERFKIKCCKTHPKMSPMLEKK